MKNLIGTHISFISKLSIVIVNFALFTILMSILIGSDKKENTIVIVVLSAFVLNSFLILFFLNWLLRRNVFCDFYLNDRKTGLEILDSISQKIKIPIQNVEGGIFYASYTYKKKIWQ